MKRGTVHQIAGIEPKLNYKELQRFTASLVSQRSKVCTKCKEEKVVELFNKDKSRSTGRFPWCKACASLDQKKYHSTDEYKIKHRIASAKYSKTHVAEIQKRRTDNKQKFRVYSKDWRDRNKLIANERTRIINKKYVDDLSDIYIKQRLLQDGFDSNQIDQYPELMETKRIILKTKRICKTLQN